MKLYIRFLNTYYSLHSNVNRFEIWFNEILIDDENKVHEMDSTFFTAASWILTIYFYFYLLFINQHTFRSSKMHTVWNQYWPLDI